MMSKQKTLDTILEFEPINLNIDSETKLDELNIKMKFISEKIAEEFNILKGVVLKVNRILNINYNDKFMNTDFDKQEYIEEYLDNLVYEYQTVKELLKKGRNIRYYKEIKEEEVEKEKENEKEKEIRYASNTLTYYII